MFHKIKFNPYQVHKPHRSYFTQTIEMVTLIPRFPFSENSFAVLVSKNKQSELRIADETPSWIEIGVASHINLLRFPFSSSLRQWFIQFFNFENINIDQIFFVKYYVLT